MSEKQSAQFFAARSPLCMLTDVYIVCSLSGGPGMHKKRPKKLVVNSAFASCLAVVSLEKKKVQT